MKYTVDKSAGDKAMPWLEDHTLETHNLLSLKVNRVRNKDKLIQIAIEYFGEATKMVGLKHGRGFL